MEIRKYMLYCRGLKFKKAELQARFWVENIGIGALPAPGLGQQVARVRWRGEHWHLRAQRGVRGHRR